MMMLSSEAEHAVGLPADRNATSANPDVRVVAVSDPWMPLKCTDSSANAATRE